MWSWPWLVLPCQAADLVPPSFLEPLAVAWPADADPEGGPAAVELLLHVDETGAVTGVELISGTAPFAEPALAAARAAHLTPARDGDQPVAVDVPLHVAFVPPPLSVEGTVHLVGGGRPAADYALSLCGHTVHTDAAGHFKAWGLPDGVCVVSSADPQGVVVDHSVDLAAGTVVTMELWARPLDDEHIVATYRRAPDEVTRRSLDAETVRVVPGSIGDPLRALQDLPGAVRAPLDTGWLLVRGGDPYDTGVYIDGVAVPLIYHLGGFTSVLHPGLIDHVELVPGAPPARYGRATAGAVDLVTRDVPAPWGAQAGANLVFAGVLGGAHVGPVDGAVAVRRSYLDGVLALVPGVTEQEAGIAPRFWDWQARVTSGPVRVFGFGLDDSIDATDTTGQPISIRVATHRLQGAVRWGDAERSAELRPFFAWEHEVFVAESASFDDQRTSWSGGFLLESRDPGTGLVGWGLGLDTLALRYGVEVGQAARAAWIVSPEPWAELRLGDTRRRLVAGVRLDTLFVGDQAPRLGVSPRLVGRLAVSDHVALTAEAAWVHQPPPWTAVVGLIEGDTFGLTSSAGGGAGVSVDAGIVHHETSLYARWMDGIVGFEDDGSLGTSSGRAYGIETLTSVRRGRWLGWLSLSYARSEREEDAGDPWVPSQYDQPISAAVVGAVDLGRRWTLAARFRYASGFRGPVGGQGSAYDVFTSTSVPLELDAQGRTQPFHTADLKVSKRFLLRRGSIDTFLDVENVYDRRVPEPLIIGFSQLRVDGQTYAFGLPVLPIFGIDVSFAGPPPT